MVKIEVSVDLIDVWFDSTPLLMIQLTTEAFMATTTIMLQPLIECGLLMMKQIF